MNKAVAVLCRNCFYLCSTQQVLLCMLLLITFNKIPLDYFTDTLYNISVILRYKRRDKNGLPKDKRKSKNGS